MAGGGIHVYYPIILISNMLALSHIKFHYHINVLIAYNIFVLQYY